ncbi:MAG: hypothetical protein ACRC13_02805 [Tannerellaceae bacterium]
MKQIRLLPFVLFFLLLASCIHDDSAFEKEISIDPETYSSNLITLKSGVIIERRDDGYYFNGDILLTPEQIILLDETGSIDGTIEL